MRRTFHSRRRTAGPVAASVLTLLGLAILAPPGAAAAIATWSGNDDDNAWTSDDNWGTFEAAPGDDLVFPQTAARKTNFNDFAAGTPFNSLTLSGTNYSIDGNPIILTGGITADFPNNGDTPKLNLDLTLGASQTFNSISEAGRPYFLRGAIDLNGHTLTLAGDGRHQIIGPITGAGSLVKSGSGTAFLSGESPSFGTTLILRGQLRVSGTLGHVQLTSGTLMGQGTVAGLDANVLAPRNGVVSPGLDGHNAGILTATGPVQFAPTSTFAVTLGGTAVGTQYDRLVYGSGLSLNGANLELTRFNEFDPAIGDQFTIISRTGTGTITGQFAQGTRVTQNGRTFTITYNSTSVVLTAVGGDFYTLPPCRVVDTRVASGPPPAPPIGAPILSSGSRRTLLMAGHCSIPPTARAVSVNITAVEPAGTGFLVFYPLPFSVPPTSNLSFNSGRSRANSGVLALNAVGEVQVRATVDNADPAGADQVHLVLDVNGYFD